MSSTPAPLKIRRVICPTNRKKRSIRTCDLWLRKHVNYRCTKMIISVRMVLLAYTNTTDHTPVPSEVENYPISIVPKVQSNFVTSYRDTVK
ncbi:hypothetical protein TNCV_4315311 [Trichonephila clavipes]|nr:hypothetical protein TNCV_4315311 [Trichonephila clavipes]